MKSYPYDAPIMSTDARIATQMNIDYAKAKIPKDLPRAERIVIEESIKQLLKEKNAVLVAHYYVDPFIQDLALATGGCVGDSLEMARFGQAHSAQTLVVAGVRFMGESAKILSMEKPFSCQIWRRSVRLIWAALPTPLLHFVTLILSVPWWFMPIPALP
ncbi:hypothetical protein Psyaliredsea_08710 [Psychrobacter alimentarius]